MITEPGTDIPRWTFVWGEGPVVASAIHDGHALRPELAPYMALRAEQRRREEDPYTQAWTATSSNRICVHRSRFEVDLNRPRHRAVYRTPAEAWGLEVWKQPLPEEVVARSLELYDAFYAAADHYFRHLLARHPRLLLLDLHSFNYRREPLPALAKSSPGPPSARDNPDICVASGFLTHDRWRPLIDTLKAELARIRLHGRALDVGENVKFRNGNFVMWAHRTFPLQVCPLEIEFKKLYMDELTGELDTAAHQRIQHALAAIVPVVVEALHGCP